MKRQRTRVPCTAATIVLASSDLLRHISTWLDWQRVLASVHVARVWNTILKKNDVIWRLFCKKMHVLPQDEQYVRKHLENGAAYARGEMSFEAISNYALRVCSDCQSTLVSRGKEQLQAETKYLAFGNVWLCDVCRFKSKWKLMQQNQVTKEYHTTVKWLAKQGVPRFPSTYVWDTGGEKTSYFYRLADLDRVLQSKRKK